MIDDTHTQQGQQHQVKAGQNKRKYKHLAWFQMTGWKFSLQQWSVAAERNHSRSDEYLSEDVGAQSLPYGNVLLLSQPKFSLIKVCLKMHWDQEILPRACWLKIRRVWGGVEGEHAGLISNSLTSLTKCLKSKQTVRQVCEQLGTVHTHTFKL